MGQPERPNDVDHHRGKTAVYILNRAKMQALLVMVSDNTTLRLNTFARFRVAVYMAEGNDGLLAADMFLPKQMEIIVAAMLVVARNGVTLDDGIDRVKIVEDRPREGLIYLHVHCRKHRRKACLPKNKIFPSKLIDEDLTHYSHDCTPRRYPPRTWGRRRWKTRPPL